MAALLGVFGRDQRQGSGAFTVGRRSTDQTVRERRLAEARIEAVEQRVAEQARRLGSYRHVQFPR